MYQNQKQNRKQEIDQKQEQPPRPEYGQRQEQLKQQAIKRDDDQTKQGYQNERKRLVHRMHHPNAEI